MIFLIIIREACILLYVFFQLCLSSVSFTIPICPAVYENPQTNIDKESIRIISVSQLRARKCRKKRKGRVVLQMDPASRRATCVAPVSIPSIDSPWQHPRRGLGFKKASKPLQCDRKKPVFARRLTRDEYLHKK